MQESLQIRGAVAVRFDSSGPKNLDNLVDTGLRGGLLSGVTIQVEPSDSWNYGTTITWSASNWSLGFWMTLRRESHLASPDHRSAQNPAVLPSKQVLKQGSAVASVVESYKPRQMNA